MMKCALPLLLAASAFAQKQPITLETLQAGGGRGGRGGAAFGGAPTWMPDGKTFITRQGRGFSLYDPATKESKLLIDTTAIDAAAIPVPPDEGPVDWTNRRARLGGMQVSSDGKLIL